MELGFLVEELVLHCNFLITSYRFLTREMATFGNFEVSFLQFP